MWLFYAFECHSNEKKTRNDKTYLEEENENGNTVFLLIQAAACKFLRCDFAVFIRKNTVRYY